jgi:hypothetical protein
VVAYRVTGVQAHDAHGRSLFHCAGAAARVKATLRRFAALTRATRSHESASMGATVDYSFRLRQSDTLLASLVGA